MKWWFWAGLAALAVGFLVAMGFGPKDFAPFFYDAFLATIPCAVAFLMAPGLLERGESLFTFVAKGAALFAVIAFTFEGRGSSGDDGYEPVEAYDATFKDRSAAAVRMFLIMYVGGVAGVVGAMAYGTPQRDRRT